MLAGLLVADDRTGAADTGGTFAARGYTTAMGLERDPIDIRVIDTDSRTLDPDEAYDRVFQAVDSNPAGAVYKKVDSTLRGNIAAETEAAMDAMEADLAIVAPAFPATGRTTAAGIHMVDGMPVAETGFGDDDENPPTTSHLPSLLGDTSYPVASLGLAAVGDGETAVKRCLTEILDAHANGVVVACDTTHDRHFRAITDAMRQIAAVTVYVGSAGLAHYVPLDARAGGVLGIVGSTSDQTLAQLDELPDECIVRLEPDLVVSQPEEAVSTILPTVRDRLAAANPVIVTAAETHQDVDTALRAGQSEGLSTATTRERIASALATTAEEITRETEIRGLFLTGGTIARTVLDALAVDGVELTGQSVASGVPVARLRGGLADGIPMVTKAGGFGEKGTITTCLDYLSRAR